MTNQLSSRNPLAGDTGHVQHFLKARYIVSVIASISLPLLYVLELYFGGYTSLSEWGLLLLLNAALALFLFLIWPYHSSSIYLRHAMLIIFLLVAAVSFTRIVDSPSGLLILLRAGLVCW